MDHVHYTSDTVFPRLYRYGSYQVYGLILNERENTYTIIINLTL